MNCLFLVSSRNYLSPDLQTKSNFWLFFLKVHVWHFFRSGASSTTSVKYKDKEQLFSIVFLWLFFGFGASSRALGMMVVVVCWWWGGWAAVASTTFVLFLLFKQIWFDEQSRTLWSVHKDCQIVFRNNKLQKSAEEKFVLGLRLLESTAAAFKVLCSSWHPAACTFLPLLNSMMMFKKCLGIIC